MTSRIFILFDTMFAGTSKLNAHLPAFPGEVTKANRSIIFNMGGILALQFDLKMSNRNLAVSGQAGK